MVRVSCTICLEDNLDLNVLRNLPCGHAFCEPCITSHIQAMTGRRGPKPSCPQCRAGPISIRDLRQVFIHFADASTSSQLPSGEDATDGTTNNALRKQVRHVKKGLDRLGPEAPISSVETAAEKIQAFQDVDDAAVLGQLVGSIATWFNTKAISVYSEILDLRERIGEVQATQESAAFAHGVELDKRDKTIHRLQDDNARLHNRLQDVEKREAAARAQAGELVRVRRLCEERDQKVKDLEKSRDSLNAMLSQNKEKLLATSARNKKFKAEVQQLQEQLSMLQNEVAARNNALADSAFDEGLDESSLMVGSHHQHEAYEDSPRLQKRRRLNDLDTNSSPTRGSSSSPPPRGRIKSSHMSSSPVLQPRALNFRSDWTVPSHQTTKKLRFKESPFPGVGSNGRPTAKASLVLGSRMRMGKNG